MIEDDERRARLAAHHLLVPATRTDDLVAITDALVALHSSDPVTVYLSAMARMVHPGTAAIEQALYVDHSLIRHHAMRRTLWVAPPGTVRAMHAAATTALVGPERRRTVRMLADSGIADPEAWLSHAESVVLADLRAHGPSTAREIGIRVPELRQRLQLAPGKSYAANQSAHTRVLLTLGFLGELLRARPVGGWTNGAYRYVAADAWLEGGLGGLDHRHAAAQLADHWLQRFGPATTADLQWWMGWSLKTTRLALADIAAVEVDLADGPGWLSARDPGPGTDSRWVAALPSLDPTTMGWKQRDWYLPVAAADAFDRNGNAGPTLWVDGRVVGAWAQTRTGEFRTHYFEKVAAARRADLEDRIAALAESVRGATFTVRFPGRIQSEILNSD